MKRADQQGELMQNLDTWWNQRSKRDIVALTIACYVLIALGSVDIGRALYQATHEGYASVCFADCAKITNLSNVSKRSERCEGVAC